MVKLKFGRMILTKDDKEDLISKIDSSQNEIIRWMFLFWIGQLAATIGIILLFVKK